ncbi:MAG: septal ring lytic transglycosylase RlpA family protein [Pseudomonadota bacterium]|nr:septal ring lytic transglycosylase RlpA family protein [Pseudomonadota bacterium]
MSRLKYAATVAIAWGLGAGVSMVSLLATAAPTNDGSARGAAASNDWPAAPQASPATPRAKRQLDRSGKKQIGQASFYKSSYAGKKMADGTPMQLYGDNAASTTLPLGTTARVTNLENRRTAVVTIRDRGPYVKGRIVDLSPGTAEKIGLARKQGLAKVEVAPLTIPRADGAVKMRPLAMAAN